MLQIIDKVIIFICCAGIYLFEPAYGLWIIPLIVAITLSSLNTYFEKPIFHILSFMLYSLLCIYWSAFVFFLPLIFYDVLLTKNRFAYLFVLIPALNSCIVLPYNTSFVIAAFMALTLLLKLRTTSTLKLREEYIKFRDQSSEISMLLKDQNAALIENQDHEINSAMLSERNRIAREVHDNLGHVLSRSLLQIGATLAVNKDPVIKELLDSTRNTLSMGMDSIRESIHNLHDESIDLHSQILGLVKGFSFCPIKLYYDISENPEKKYKYSFIAIVKEALSNIIKHSNASEVTVSLKEHPGLYQLVIQDNGTIESYSTEKGIGLSNIQDRVSAFNGNINITTEHGFKIFISIPKEN